MCVLFHNIFSSSSLRRGSTWGVAVVAELITGKGGHSKLHLINIADRDRRCSRFLAALLAAAAALRFNTIFCNWVNGFDEILAVVLRAAADAPEDAQPRRRRCVRIDVDYLAALDILEKSHGGVSCVVLDHVRVLLALAHVEGRMLENAPLPIRALRRMLKEVLANRCQVLPTEPFLLLELLLPVGKPTALLLLAVLALLPIQPKPAQLRLYLLLPPVLLLHNPSSLLLGLSLRLLWRGSLFVGLRGCRRCRSGGDSIWAGLFAGQNCGVADGRVETTDFGGHVGLEVWVVAVFLWADGGAVSDGARGVVAVLCQLLADFAQRQDGHRRRRCDLLGVHLARLPKRLMLLLHRILDEGLHLLEILLRIGIMLEIHLELRHELLLRKWLHGLGVGVSCTPIVGVVLLHLVWLLLDVVDLVMVDRCLLVVSGGEGPRFVLELLTTTIGQSLRLKGLLLLLGLGGLWCTKVMLFITMIIWLGHHCLHVRAVIREAPNGLVSSWCCVALFSNGRIVNHLVGGREAALFREGCVMDDRVHGARDECLHVGGKVFKGCKISVRGWCSAAHFL